MRTALVAGAITLGACHSFDPIREVPHRHREAASTADAIAMILAEPHADHLIVETWLDASCWGNTREQVSSSS